MSEIWTEQRLQQYIDDEVPESLSLEYKRGTVLSKNAKKNPKWLDELTKDISALANSAGGVLIYGIAENNDKPTEFAPVDKTEFSRETLDQIISSNIKPRIEDLIIHPVTLSSGENDIVYVIEIPQSNTAHQAYDKRYHKRLNTTTVWMEDYEIRDVMGRGQHPKINLEFELEFNIKQVQIGLGFNTLDYLGRSNEPDIEEITTAKIIIKARNVGSTFANYINAFFKVPTFFMYSLLDNEEKEKVLIRGEREVTLDEEQVTNIYEDNTTRDIVDYEFNPFGSIPKYGVARYEPVLPQLAQVWEIDIDPEIAEYYSGNKRISWEVFADNSPSIMGSVLLQDIPISDLRLTNPEE